MKHSKEFVRHSHILSVKPSLRSSFSFYLSVFTTIQQKLIILWSFEVWEPHSCCGDISNSAFVAVQQGSKKLGPTSRTWSLKWISGCDRCHWNVVRSPGCQQQIEYEGVCVLRWAISHGGEMAGCDWEQGNLITHRLKTTHCCILSVERSNFIWNLMRQSCKNNK